MRSYSRSLVMLAVAGLVMLSGACSPPIRVYDAGAGGEGGSGSTGTGPFVCSADTDCVSLVDDCNNVACVDGTCEKNPARESDLCDDDDPCTLKTTCSSGVCQGGEPTDCSALNGPCGIGACDPQMGCVVQPINELMPCNDDLFCTVNDVCFAGACTGESQPCDQGGSSCTVGSCNEELDMCEPLPAPDGAPCDDKNACTTSDVCAKNACGGTPVNACQSGDGCCPSGCLLAKDDDCAPLSQPSYDASMTFKDALTDTTMGLTWDGTYFWTCTGGNSDGDRLARYSAAGALLQTYQPMLDLRAVFTKGDAAAPVYARAYAGQDVLVQNAPGSFVPSVTLNGALDAQSNVAYDASTAHFVAFNAGTVTRWTNAGALVSTTMLVGFGNLNNENQSPQNRGIVARNGLYLTYSEGVLSSWDAAGQRQKTTVLNSAGVDFNSHFSLSYGAGMVWIVDAPGGLWRGYNVGF